MVGQHLYMGDLCYCGFIGELFFLYTLGDDLNHYCNFLFQMNCDRKKKGTCAHSLKEKESLPFCVYSFCAELLVFMVTEYKRMFQVLLLCGVTIAWHAALSYPEKTYMTNPWV